MANPSIAFPVLAFNQGIVVPIASGDELARCTATALRRGWFKGLRLIGGDGRRYKVTGARKLHGIGPFFGFDWFGTRRIRVDLDIVEDSRPATLEELKTLVRKAFSHDHGWSSREDFDELKRRLEAAREVKDVFALLRE
jgi:hypothetical protein